MYLLRQDGAYRPYKLPYPLKGHVGSIRLYHSGQMFFHVKTGWFETSHGQDVECVDLGEAPVQARLVNLHRADHFLIRDKNSFSTGKEYDLYIHCIPEQCGSIITNQDEYQITTANSWFVPLACKMRVTGNEMNGFYVTEGWRTVNTPAGDALDAVQKELIDLGIGLNSMDVKTLLEHYTLTRKEMLPDGADKGL